MVRNGDLERRFENTVWKFGNIKRIDKDIICVEYGKYNKGNFTFYITTLKLYYSTKKRRRCRRVNKNERNFNKMGN